MIVFASDVDREQHIALGPRRPDRRASARALHSHCSPAMPSGPRVRLHDIIEHSLEAIVAENRGVFVYLHHTGRRLRDRFPPRLPRRPAAYSIITRAAS